MMKKILVVAMLALLVVAGWLALAPGGEKQPVRQDAKAGPDKVSVRMKWFFAGTMTGWFAGKDEGIFAKNGMDIAIIPGGPDNSSIKLVAAGTDDFGVAGADEVLLARAKGIPVVAVAVLFKESPICFISKKARGINGPQDWSGKTIEVDYGSNAEIQYRALVVKYKPVNIKEVPYAFSLVPFIGDKVDVSVAYRMDQAVTLARQGIELSITSARDHGINPYGDVIITTEKTLRERPDLVKRFVKAAVAGFQWAIDHPQEAVASLVRNAPELKADNEAIVWRETIPFLVAEGGAEAIGEMKDDRWKDTMDQLLEFKALAAPVDLTAAYRNVPDEH